ncbi:RNA polymerase sigma factor [Halomonas denitrificans]|uniref:RNA polymerase sigma factor n=1 Tax=Halomonas TaxID=2745 RepID=UPI001C93CFDB|nr:MULTISPECIES: RNA polymerase sigma factor [Halomonas]MBY5925705.1 RNA polymerase sigma factor [Halomonas sp. DP4Y7-2]MBY6030570.1 RNA polymerase sigma factor [Halomonas sp. DP8Y7-1]MBY6232476.1 RNA polymerase sigma factor [Halomonas sp. DP4Y7-1]MCA0976159.1 RNA polymerase sigma factor [Halomonas denitrificans]
MSIQQPEARVPTDIELVKGAAGGEREAFARLLSRHYDRLFALAWRLTGSRAEAEDLTQDICLALPDKLPSFDGRAAFSTWLYRVAVNAAHDRRRQQATRRKAAEGWEAWEQDRHRRNRQRDDEQRWLARAMATLSMELRDTVALSLGEGMTQAQVAEVLEVSEGTVAWRMSEVKRQLSALARGEEER